MIGDIRDGQIRRLGFGAVCWLGLLLSTPPAQAQGTQDGLRVFGFFQSQFQARDGDDEDFSTSFSTQQLNLFLQRPITPRWFAFVNFEAVNSYSSRHGWGSFGLEEAWVRYSFLRQHNIKIGQFIPVYNGFNEVKNRMPVFPYIVRPLVYESSYDDFLALEEYWPARGYLQASGWFARGADKLEYAVYLGNSPNINSDPSWQTGIDTTDAMLVGGRLGLRRGDVALGLSYTRERVDIGSIDNTFVQHNRQAATDMGWKGHSRLLRQRRGFDLSWNTRRFFLDAEGTEVDYSGLKLPRPRDGTGGPPGLGGEIVDADEDLLEALHPSLDKQFVYATLGMRPTEQTSVYATLWIIEEDLFMDGLKIVIRVPSVGASWHLNDRITFKAQCALDEIATEVEPALSPHFPIEDDEETGYLGALAVTVFF